MGDRANVCVKADDRPPLFLYTHYHGSDLPEILARALDRGRSRWGDTGYLARIIFCEMISGDGAIAGTTGFAIGTVLEDNSHPILVVDDTLAVVGLATEADPANAAENVSYLEFIADPRSLPYGDFPWR